MFERITTLITHLTTEKDNQTFCPARILWILSSLVYFGLAGYQVWHTKSFDYMQFAGGFAALQASGSAAVKIKETTEQQVG